MTKGVDKVLFVEDHLRRVFDMGEVIEDLHPCLTNMYPIAVAQENKLSIYVPDKPSKTYHFASSLPMPFPLPEKIRAAFPIDGYENTIACVVTPDVFSSLEEYATIFHEFVHCYQFEECELELKNSLSIARHALARGDFAWELNYPFPYDDPSFCDLYSALLHSLDGNDSKEIHRSRAALRDVLEVSQFEYMVWQEWKEGFARYIENRICLHLGFPLNCYGGSLPFERTVFYYGGAKFIDFLARSEPGLVVDIRNLFEVFWGVKP